jgi:molybdopterin molybdotransferase
MIAYSEASEILLNSVRPLEPEPVPLACCLGRVLAVPLEASVDSPRFDNSAVDGYAFRSEGSAAGRLRLVAEVRAGAGTPQPLGPGEAARVSTGAPIPPKADRVAMQEQVELEEGGWIRLDPSDPHAHIRHCGEEFQAGERLIDRGERVTPPVVALAAGQGATHLAVYRVPRIGVLSTGSELVSSGHELRDGQIYESNSQGIAAACRHLGVPPISVGTVGDDPEQTYVRLRELVQNCDLVITTGGVSVGDYDLVREATCEIGIRELFWRVAIKPGKPVYFGMAPEGPVVLGLPGNPVSALVAFTLFAVPAIRAMMGRSAASADRTVVLGASISHQPGRTEFVRAEIREGKAFPLRGQGSHMLGSLARASGLVHLPADSLGLEAGESAVWTPLPWGDC